MTIAPGERGERDVPSVRVDVLGTGSCGNCSVLRFRGATGTCCLLVDAGFSPRRTVAGLAALGLEPADVAGIVLTHPDRDHLHTGWATRGPRFGWRLHLQARHRGRAVRDGFDGRLIERHDGAFSLPVGESAVSIEPVQFAHDDLGSIGYVMEFEGLRIGWATDLGRVPPWFRERFTRLHLLAIESNYDPGMQAESGRPAFLQHRITGGSGHLSNDESLDAVLQAERTSSLRHLVLLHRSQQCNDPSCIHDLYAERAPHLVDRLTIADQDVPSPPLELGPADRARPMPGPTVRVPRVPSEPSVPSGASVTSPTPAAATPAGAAAPPAPVQRALF